MYLVTRQERLRIALKTFTVVEMYTDISYTLKRLRNENIRHCNNCTVSAGAVRLILTEKHPPVVAGANRQNITASTEAVVCLKSDTLIKSNAVTVADEIS